MKTILLLLCVAVVPSCKSTLATVRDYFDLWFVVPKNPFHPTTTNDTNHVHKKPAPRAASQSTSAPMPSAELARSFNALRRASRKRAG